MENVAIDVASQSVSDDEGRRRKKARLKLRMNSPGEIPIPREDGDGQHTA